jgi:hypothetical protein
MEVKKMTNLLTILEKYKSRAGEDSPEQDFFYKHTDNVSVFDGPGVAEIRAAIDAAPGHAVNTELRHGYKPDEDASVYESFDIEQIREALQITGLDEDTINEIEQSLIEDAEIELHQMVGEAVADYYNSATEEEQQILDEMLSTDEGYEELLDMIFENGDEEDDEDEENDEDEEDDED